MALLVVSELLIARFVEWCVMAGWLDGREDGGRHCLDGFVVVAGVLMGVSVGVDGLGGLALSVQQRERWEEGK